MKYVFSLLLFNFLVCVAGAQKLPGFRNSESFDEQQLVIEDTENGTRILINAPLEGFGKKDKVLLVFYALPNGSSIEHTFGRKAEPGIDYRYDIQHIGAQTRFLRRVIRDRTIVVAYLENSRLSWPSWVANTTDPQAKIREIVDCVTGIFARWEPETVLNGHSGGGRFIFSYIDSAEEIPSSIVRIGFLDSTYGYEDTLHGKKISGWLMSGRNRYLCTLAYNDSVVIYNGKPLVSPTGGTWYRSKMMKNYLSGYFRFREKERDSLQWSTSPGRRIEFILKPNPERKIYHTSQVELNGFIHSMLSGTKHEQKNYTYYGKRAYSDLINDSIVIPVRMLNIPVRDPSSESGSEFMNRIRSLSPEDREEEIYKAVSSGNIPDFLRDPVTMSGEFRDSRGKVHRVVYEVTPDYISVGSNEDFCRIPMNPYTAQKVADDFGASLITSVISDIIHRSADIRLEPFYYAPVGHENESAGKFIEHNMQIEKQLSESGGRQGDLVSGIKKDVILSSRIGAQPGKVVIYGWHRPDGKPIQPVYSGHIYWYVDYSHGVRLINNQVLIDGKPKLFTEILQDPVLFKIFSDEDTPMKQPAYRKPGQDGE